MKTKILASDTPVYRTTVLANGLRVLTVPLHETKAATVLVLCKVGSRYESKNLNGVSHFVEHLMFKGTKRRPNTLSIARLLDGVGAEYNAFTSKDHTGYYVKINHEHFDLALDVVADILHNSKFDPVEIDRERQVIVEEISMYEENPLMYIEDVFERTLFSGHPLGQLIAGPRQVIKQVSRAAIVRFFKTHYYPANMIVVVAGRFDEARILADIERHFGDPSQTKPAPKAKAFKFKPGPPRFGLETKTTEQVQIGLGYPGLSYFDRQLPAFSLLSTILGGNMSSRLFIQIRERRGLAYAIHCSPSVYEDTGSLFIQAGVAKQRVEEAIKAILEELKKVRSAGVTPAELRRAKEYVKGKLILELEDSASVAAWLGKQWLLTGKIERPADKLKKIEAVTRADISALGRRLIRASGLTLALIGPFHDRRPFLKQLG